MILNNWINYKKIMCKCSKVEEGIKLIFEEEKEESIDSYEFTKNENVKLFVEFSKNIIKLVGKDFMNDKDKSINDMKEKDKILDLLIEYIEKVGFFLNISSKKEFIWKIKNIDYFVKEDVIYSYLHYEIFDSIRNNTYTFQKGSIINQNIECLNLSYLYKVDDLYIGKIIDMDEKFYSILISDIYNTINDNNLISYFKLGGFISNNLYITLNFSNLYTLILYILLDKYIYLRHKYHFYRIKDKIYHCEECGIEFERDNMMDNYFPKNMRYCDECRKKLQQNYKDDYKEKVKIINELRQYKGKIPKEYNDLRNEYNRFMRSIDNRKKGDKLPNLNDLDKMLLKLKNIK